MFTITKLKMWRDPGYTRECLEVPPVGSKKLPTPDYVSTENLRPRRGATLSAIELPLSYLEVYEMSYLYMEAEDGRDPANTISVFGWILSIEETASGNEAVRITWTPDYWRTYAGSATFGKGTITRCNNATYKRPYPVSPRQWRVTAYEAICRGYSDWQTYPFWVVVTYLTKVNDQVTDIATYFWQTGFSTAKSVTVGGTTYNGVPLTKVFAGNLPGLLGLNPDAIVSIFICPHPPESPYSATFIPKGSYYMYRADVNLASQMGTTFSRTYESGDLKKAVIVDPTGAIVYTLPWGYGVNDIYYMLDSGTVGCYLDISLRMSGTSPAGVENAPIGKNATIPCICAPLNSNGWSSYNYSGQRAYDIETKRIQREENAIRGVVNSGSSALAGGVGGAMVGKGAGAGIGAGLGASMSIFTAGLDMMISGKYNDMYQKAEDALHANQASTVIQSAGGVAFINTVSSAGNWYIVQLEGDIISQAEYTTEINNNGYETNIPVGSPNSFLTAGGPLQIQNLMLTGPIPPEAKTNIKNILSNGVRIVENNPTGVNP